MKVILVRFVYKDLPQRLLSISSDKGYSILVWVRSGREQLHKGKYVSCFQGDGEEQRALSAFVALLPPIQNDPYAKGMSLGVAYSDPLHTLENATQGLPCEKKLKHKAEATT